MAARLCLWIALLAALASAGCHRPAARRSPDLDRQGPVETSPASDRQVDSTPAVSYVDAEAAHMAREDQERTAQSLRRPEKVRYRDNPMRTNPR